MLTKVAGEFDEGHRPIGAGNEPLADLGRVVRAAIVDEHDFASTFDGERAQLSNQLFDGGGGIVQRHHNGESRFHGGHSVICWIA